jgi:hypothetical protein
MSTKQNDDAYVIEDDNTRKSFKLSFEWLKTRNGKVIAVAAVAVIVGGSAVLASAAGTKVAHQLPVENSHHSFFNPMRYSNEYGSESGSRPRFIGGKDRLKDQSHPKPFGPPPVHVNPKTQQAPRSAPKPPVAPKH